MKGTSNISMRREMMLLQNECVQKITEQWAQKAEKEKRKLVRKKAVGKYYRKG
jgi:hypothetical protein